MSNELMSMNEDRQIQAAYALNLCTVSISQIVDYNDENILEQEYEAILNNLNLEKMPSDEALLNILTQILDTVTFFRIQEGDKAMVEREYQFRMKNAIWSAVPNISVFVPCKNMVQTLVTNGLNLAAQVGTAYMNYRKEKAKAKLEADKKMWMLQRAAIEQLNGLRRELFTTAWRLSAEYNFPDEYRLTEKQIEQYNTILMDADELRKYERLDAIKDNFKAYPPFWYYLGHTANYIATSETLSLSSGGTIEVDDEIRAYYTGKARESFEKYDELRRYGLLREDQMRASFDLEYADLLLQEARPGMGNINNGIMDKVVNLLEDSVRVSGNANDIMQMCAISYIKIRREDQAVDLLRRLVNEDYNRDTNAKLLSRIYVSGCLRHFDNRELCDEYSNGYKMLSGRVPEERLYPMPPRDNYPDIEDNLDNKLQAKFIDTQADLLIREYLEVVESFQQKYSSLFIQVLLPALALRSASEEDDSVHWNMTSMDEAEDYVQQIFSDGDRKKAYLEEIAQKDLAKQYVDLLNESMEALATLSVLRDNSNTVMEMMIYNVQKSIRKHREFLTNIQRQIRSGNINAIELREALRKLSFQSFTENAFRVLISTINGRWKNGLQSQAAVSEAETDLMQFCMQQELPIPKVLEDPWADRRKEPKKIKTGIFDYELLCGKEETGTGEEQEDEKKSKKDRMIQVIKESRDKLFFNDSDKAELLIRGDRWYDYYFHDVKNIDVLFVYDTLAVIDDKTMKDVDLILRTDGVYCVKHGCIEGRTPYAEVSNEKDALRIYPMVYENKKVNMVNLFALISKLKEISESSAE